MPLPAYVQADRARRTYWVAIAAATVAVVGLGAWGISRFFAPPVAGAGSGSSGSSGRRPVAPGIVGCPGGLDFGVPQRGDSVAIELEDADGKPVEYAWMLVRSVSPDRDAVQGVLIGSLTGEPLQADKHRFSAGTELQVLMDCLVDRIRTTSSLGEPVCGPAGAVAHDLEEPTGYPQRNGRDDVVGRRLLATVGPKIPGGRIPTLEQLEPVVVEVYAVSPLGVARGTVAERTEFAALHGYDLGTEVDLTPGCVFGVDV